MMVDPYGSWVDDIAYELLGGRRLLLRLPPRVGKTHLLRRLEKAIGPSAIYVDGSKFTESAQKLEREALDARILEALEKHGAVQVLFDSYDRAVSRSGGARLQSWLNSRLVDGEWAQDIGAIFSARCASVVQRPGAGSPLLSRVSPVDPPELEWGNDAIDFSDAQEWFGTSALLAHQATRDGNFRPVAVADRCEQDSSYLKDVREAASELIRRERIDLYTDSVNARSAVHGLLTNTGGTLLFARLKAALQESPALDPRWPADWSGSVTKFAELVGDARTVTWCDRYMYRDIEALRSFVRSVVATTGCEVRLLGAREVSERTISRAEMQRLNLLPGVEARFMLPADLPALHDRHLFANPGGFVIPQVHVIVGKQHPGSAVAAPTAKFGVNYNEIWGRALIV